MIELSLGIFELSDGEVDFGEVEAEARGESGCGSGWRIWCCRDGGSGDFGSWSEFFIEEILIGLDK